MEELEKNNGRIGLDYKFYNLKAALRKKKKKSTDLNLSEDALVKFIQVLHMPDQEGSVSGVDGEQHVWAFVPLSDQCFHLPL